jgi:hypothetical protein
MHFLIRDVNILFNDPSVNHFIYTLVQIVYTSDPKSLSIKIIIIVA